jgi:glycerophosphoryl diester phosphodiesterase
MRLLAFLLVLLAAPAAAFDLQGHRGARGLAPENTIPGFATALAVGVSTLELDLALTADGVLVASHDPRLNPDLTRAPDGTWLQGQGPPIRSLTLAALRIYDVGRIRPDSRYARRYPRQRPVDGARIPTLAQVFDLVRDTPVRLNVEPKSRPGGDDAATPDEFARALVAAIRGSGMAGRVTVQSFDWRTLVLLRELAPEIVRVCLTSEGSPNNLGRGWPEPSPWLGGHDLAAHAGSTPHLVRELCPVWSPNFRDLRPAELAAAKALGLSVIPWTVNLPPDMDRLVAWGVDGLITDDPDLARDVLAARGLPLPEPVRPP